MKGQDILRIAIMDHVRSHIALTAMLMEEVMA
jgi:hypothetical protein